MSERKEEREERETVRGNGERGSARAKKAGGSESKEEKDDVSGGRER